MLKIIEKIKDSKNILIFTHTNPDGDAIGSCYALKKALETIGKNATIILEMPLSSLFDIFEGSFCVEDEIKGQNFDLKISLDCGDFDRLGEIKSLFVENTINIDHHYTNSKFADLNYVDGDCAATGEIIFRLLNHMNISFNEEISNGLYVSILTDTGGFMYANTTSETHKIASKLIEAGADYYNLNNKFFQEKSFKKHQIFAKCIEIMEFYNDNKIAVSVFDQSLCEKLEITSDEINGLSSLPRSVTGVEVGILITELHKESIKVSLRSDHLIDVSEIATSFGGGGHKRASGFSIEGELNKVKETLINATVEQFKKVK